LGVARLVMTDACGAAISYDVHQLYWQ